MSRKEILINILDSLFNRIFSTMDTISYYGPRKQPFPKFLSKFGGRAIIYQIVKFVIFLPNFKFLLSKYIGHTLLQVETC